MKVFLIFFITFLFFVGCGSSVSIDAPENISRSKPSELFITLAKELYYVGEKFDNSFKATDEYDRDITDEVVVEGTVDTQKEGEYELLYKLIDKNKVLSVTKKTVTVKINKDPKIILYGDKKIDIYLGGKYEEPGFEAKDEEDGDISKNVKITGFVDTSKEGVYTIAYKVFDSFGNSADEKREIRVIPPDDIREKVLIKSGYSSDFSFSLWDYMVNKRDDSFTVTKYVDNLKTGSQIDDIKKISSNEYGISFPYTLRTLNYINNNDGTIKIAFKKENDTTDFVMLKDHAKLNTPITVGSSSENDKSCRILEHYEKIKLNDTPYVDVIKIGCGFAEAYFAKNRGIILQNTLIQKKQPLFVSGLKSEIDKQIRLKNITDKTKTPLSEMNLKSMIQSNTEMLAYNPYNLHGENMKIGVVDEGGARTTHKEFEGRVINDTSEPISPHTTHVTGTIAASGIDKDARGYANKVKVEVLSYYDTYFSNAVKELYNKGILISNHSYGPADYYSVGEYGSLARDIDEFVAIHPEVLVVNAAGNDRTTDGYGDYGIIKDFGNAKNIITVGAVNYDDTISFFSSTGPVKGGRIKPDIVAKGYLVKSVGYESDDSYIYMSGTSMASPAVTGAVALLNEEYMKINDNDTMREDVAKAIMVNSAKDLGREGPDYEFGFGLLNSLEAVKIIDSLNSPKPLVLTNELAAEQKHIYDLNISSLSLFKASLCWIDPVLGSDTSGELTNDLDMTIVDEDYQSIYAFTLDPNNPEKPAQKDKYNRVDNVEQIEVKLPKGNYKLIVTVHKMQTQKQKYALASNMPLPNPTIDSSYSKIDEFETTILNSVR